MTSTPRPTSTDPPHAQSALSSTDRRPSTSPRPTLEDVELSDAHNGSATKPLITLEEDIMQCARLGETGLLQNMFDSGKFGAKYQDSEGITPLHVCV